MTTEPLYILTLRPLRDPLQALGHRPVPIRLRWLMKMALRVYGFQAVSVAEVEPDFGPECD